MNRMRMILTLFTLLIGIGFVGCNTEEYNLRTIKDERTYVSSDSTSTHMKWRTKKWSDSNAKYWTSASVIITTPENTLDPYPSAYWLKKIVSKGFKGVILIEENFDYLPLSWESEPNGSYKNDLYTYFTSTIENEDWAVRSSVPNRLIIVDHPTLGISYVLNPKTMTTVWGSGAYEIMSSHIESMKEYVGGTNENFQVWLYQPYNLNSWKVLEDLGIIIEATKADPLGKGYGVSQYTVSDMAEFTTISDERVDFVMNKEYNLVVYGNRVNSSTSKISNGAIDGIFINEVTPQNVSDVVSSVETYRSSYTPETSESSLLIIGGVLNDVYHTTPTDYATMLKTLIDNAIYFTPGANDSYFEYPNYKPGDWWIRSNSDYNWQNNRNNPTYTDIATYPRKIYNITPPTPVVDVTPPSAPTNLVATGIDAGVSLNWDNNIESDFSHYAIYISANGENGLYSILNSNTVPTYYNDMGGTIGFEYWYKVKAIDTSGNVSSFSNADSGIPTDQTNPDPPTSFIIIPSNETMNLSWSKPNPDVVSYEIYRSIVSEAAVIASTTPYTTTTTPSYVDTPLANGQQFWYTIIAVDGYGNKSTKCPVVSSSPYDDTTPTAPTGFTATAGDGEVVLNWNENIDAYYFTLYASTTISTDAAIISIPAIADELRTYSYTHTPLDNGTTYYYQLRYTTQNDVVSERTEVISARPQASTPPDAPSGLGITVVNGSYVGSTITNPTITLNWTASPTATSYNIYRGTSADGETFLTSTTGTTWSDTPYNATTAPNGFINGSPYYYKVVALNTSVAPPLVSAVSSEVSGRAKCIRTLPFPFYSVMWYRDIPDSYILTTQDIQSLSSYDGIISTYFDFEPNELGRRNLVTRLRNVNQDEVVYTYVNIQGPRNDWEEMATNSSDPNHNTPFAKIWEYCAADDNSGFAKNVNGDVVDNGSFSTKVINFTKPGIAEFIAKTWVDAYQNSGMDGEYTGLYLDFMDMEFQDWVYPTSNNDPNYPLRPYGLDADQDGIPYATDTALNGNGVAESQMYDDYNLEILKAFRKEFADRNMNNRLLMFNGDAFHESNIAALVDGWHLEYFNHDLGYGVPGSPTTSSEVETILSSSSNMASQIDPPSIYCEAHADSNAQYDSEVLAMAAHGWIQENAWSGYQDETCVVGPQYTNCWLNKIQCDLRAEWQGQSALVPNLPYTNGTRLPDCGTYNGRSYKSGTYFGSPRDTLIVDYENYDLYMVLGRPGGQWIPWSYYVEVPNGEVYRRAPTWQTPYPSTPTGFTATSSALGGILNLTWNANPNPSLIDHYNVYRADSFNGSLVNPVLIGTSVTTAFSDNTVNNGQVYYYGISAVNNRTTHLESGKGTGVGVSYDTTPPDAPTGVTATVGDKRVVLNWNVSSGASTYSVKRNGGIIASGLTQPSYVDVDPTLVNGTEYTYHILAVDNALTPNASTSDPVYATPVATVETLTFSVEPTLNNVTSTNSYLSYGWSAVLGQAANSKSIHYKNAESIPDTSTFSWNSPTTAPAYTVTTSIPTPTRDGDTNVSLVWSQTNTGSFTHYHIERSLNGGSYSSISTSTLNTTTTYLDGTAPRGKLTYRIAAATGTHGVSETVGNWVTLTKVDTSTGTAVYNEASELKVIVDIAKDSTHKLRQTTYPMTSVYVAPDITPPSVVGIFNATSFDTTDVNNVKVTLSATALENVQTWAQTKIGVGGTYEPSNPNWLPTVATTVVSQSLSTNTTTAALKDKTVYTRFKLRDESLVESDWVETSSVFIRKPTINGYMTTITIPESSVPGTSNMTNFPILLTQSNFPTGFFNTASPTGADIRFTTDLIGQNFIPREIVSFSRSNSTAEIWVKIPTLYATSPTVIYCWYGDPLRTEPDANSTYGKYAVWSDYCLVLHMTESGSLIDSSSGKIGTKLTTGFPSQIAGQIGYAQSFTNASPASPYIISFPYDASFAIGTGNATWSVWSIYNGVAGFISHTNGTGGSSGYWWKIPNWTSNPNCVGFTMGDRDHASLAMPWVNGSYSMITVTKNASDITFYRNGQSYGGTPTTGTETNNITDWNGPLLVGLSRSVYSTTACTSTMDELRICKIVRDSNWLTTEYNNQNNPTTFATSSSPILATDVNIGEQ